MMNPSWFTWLLAPIKEPVGIWTTERIILIAPLDDIENEPTYQSLKEQGVTFRWWRLDQKHQRIREGWEQVVKRDRFGRPRIFMGGRQELVLMQRQSDESA
jgi:hypothetical protein